MNIKLIFSILSVIICLNGCRHEKNTDASFTIENEFLARTLSVEQGRLSTVSLANKLSGKELMPKNYSEFQLRISQGTDVEGSDTILTSNEFEFQKVSKNSPNNLSFILKNREYNLEVEVNYLLENGNSYMNKYLNIRSERPITLERIDIETISLNDIYQPYKMKQITTLKDAGWRPGLGQPLYTKDSATFWGTEFPASFNYVENNTGFCGYSWGKKIKDGQVYTTYKSVFGVGDSAEFIQDTFFEYIDDIRIRPLRLQVQYNSWFDYFSQVDREKFKRSVKKINQELNTEREVPPLNAYVIDDGWEDVKTDWSDNVWKVNDKFDSDFSSSLSTVMEADSTLGLWLSPGCNFNCRPAVPSMRENGLEALDEYMSLAGPKYMQLLESRMIELTKQGISFFKLDGLFGHLNRRELFDENGWKYDLPTMPQLGVDGFDAADERLNDPKYDELKTYYLVAGTERLMQLFKKQHQINPNVYIVISNGAYLSPWWLQYIDTVWMINAGDAAEGSNRTQELIYRDNVYYETWVEEKTQFPFNSVFNHEPKKTETGEGVKQFSEYLWMSLSRGTGFLEFYINTEILSEIDWGVMADGLKWAHKVFPYFKYSRMHGGDPKNEEVYGYSGFNEKGGYASFHNPSGTKEQAYIFILNRAFGVKNDLKKLSISSPLSNEYDLVGKVVSKGDAIEIKLKPREVKILEFDRL
ncbi:hypothetical protein AB1F87_002048 [Vibrio mimicus]